MTIIPFRLTEPQTVVTSRTAFRADGDAVLIIGLDKEQFTAQPRPATYDLRVGSLYRDHRWLDPRPLEEDGDPIVLAPGAAVIIATLEELQLPESRFGQIAPKVRLLERGIANTPSKVDPGYSGHLNITVFNHGRREVRLAYGEPFCALFISDVQLPVDGYEGPAKQVTRAPGVGYSWWDQLVDFVERRAGVLSVIALVVGAIAAVANLFR